ncbi:MAG: methyltransferase [Tissierellia bacterium]|nr:methyltransferase [Tissierellia bacterium]
MVRKDYIPNTDFYIFQEPGNFSFGTDSLMLLDFSIAKGKVVDLGCGTGILSLGLAARSNVEIIYSVDIQTDVLELLKKSIAENKLGNKVIPVLSGIEDFMKVHPIYPNAVIMNPPYFENDIENEKENHRISRHHLGIEPWIATASKMLQTKGTLELVYRPQRLAELTEIMRKYRIEPKVWQFVRTKAQSQAKSVLVRGVKDGGTGLKIMPDIITHYEDGKIRNWTNDLIER